MIGFSLFAPLAIVYFSRVSGSYALGASIFGITMLASAVFEVPTGVWSDRMGRRKTIILGSWSRVLAYIFYALGLSYWFLTIGAILEGLSRAFYSGNNDALLHDTLADDNLADDYDVYLGKTSAAEQLALALSATLGGIIASFSFSWLLWISVFAQAVVLLLSYKFIEPRKRSTVEQNVYVHIKEAFNLFVKNRKLRLLSLASIATFSLNEIMYQFRAAFIVTVWPLWAVGFANTIPNLGATWSFYYGGQIIRRFGAMTVLLFKTIWGKFIGLISYGFPSVLSPILTSTGSLMYGAGEVAEKSLMQKEFSDKERATMSSLNTFGGSIGFAIMSLILGGLADVFGPARALFILTIMGIPLIYMYWILFRREQRLVP